MASATSVDTEVLVPPEAQTARKVPGPSTEVAVQEPEARGLPRVKRQISDREHHKPYEDEVLSRDGDGCTDCRTSTGVPRRIDG
jgi:hypothetical protein